MTPAVHVYPYAERPEVVAKLPQSIDSLLDVGCSRGGFGAAVRRDRPDIHLVGIEADAEAAREASKHYDRMIHGTFPDDLPPELSFDCIVFNDVLEHLVDPWSALRDASRALRPSGSVIASIPNVRAFRHLIDLVVHGDWRYEDMGILDRTHLRFFTRRSMVRMFEECGYEVRQVHGIFPLGSRWHLAPLLAWVLRDVAFLEFVVDASPKSG